MSDRRSRGSWRGSWRQERGRPGDGRPGDGRPGDGRPGDGRPAPRYSPAPESESRDSQVLSWRRHGDTGTRSPSREPLLPTAARSGSNLGAFGTDHRHSEPIQDVPCNQSCSLLEQLPSRSLASAVVPRAVHPLQSFSPHSQQHLSLGQRIPQVGDPCFRTEEPSQNQTKDSRGTSSSSADGTIGSQMTSQEASRSVIQIPESATSTKQQQVTVDYSSKDVYLFRLRKMFTSVGRRVMHQVFLESTKERPREIPLFDFYEKNNVNVKVFQKNLNDYQKEKIQKDAEGQNFDITLLFMCIQYGHIGVADGKDKRWKDGTECLESRLTELKNKRNELFHDDLSIDEEGFFKRTEKLRELLTKILQHMGTYYKLQQCEVEGMIDRMNEDINCLRDKSLIPLDLEQYKKQNLFSEKREFVQLEGRLWLIELYGNWVYISPASLVCDVDFKVKDIYTEMVLRGESEHGKKVPVNLENLLDQLSYVREDPVILLEGLAGVGKTTLTKKIMDDWVSGHSSITNLNSYDLLLYAECRDKRNKSFQDLVTSLMSEVAKSFQDTDFVNVILDHKVLVMIDGLDEFNSSSMSLFTEILELKKTHGITVLATTRPERVKTYYEMAKSKRIKTKHIELKGVPKEKLEDFVTKYHEELKRKGKTKENVSELLNYLRRTALRLSHLWKLPYNLTLLTVLWVYRPMIINQITREPELYWAIHQLLLDKLFERLRGNLLTWDLAEALVKRKVKSFTYTLSYEALNGLANDEINLSDESLNRLEDACSKENLPTDEMTGAFLKRITMKTKGELSARCSFPHKGLQDFLGALYILMLTKHEIEDQVVERIMQEIENTLSSHNVADEISQNVLRLTYEELTRHALPSTSAEPIAKQTNRVRGILVKLHTASKFDVSKYQNLLITLIGLFHLEEMKIKDSIKLEVLELLKETGVSSREDWMRILSSVKCDKFVANFVSHQLDMFKGYIKINDATLLAYVSLLQSLTDPVKDAHKVNVSINVEEMSPINELLLEEINKKKLKVKRLLFHQDFRRPETQVISEDVLNEVFRRCQVTEYWGAFTEDLQLSPSMNSLRISLASEVAYKSLNKFLPSYKGSLALCIAPSLNSSTLVPISAPECLPDLYLCDVDRAKLMNAVDIAKKLQPSSGKHMKFGRILFPRSSLNDQQDLRLLIEEMHQAMVRVCFDVSFPSSTKPADDNELQEEAKKRLGCKQGVKWGGGNIDDW